MGGTGAEESHAGVISASGQWSDRGDEESGHWTFGDIALISTTSQLSRHFAIKGPRSGQTLSLYLASKELTSSRWSSRYKSNNLTLKKDIYLMIKINIT